MLPDTHWQTWTCLPREAATMAVTTLLDRLLELRGIRPGPFGV